VCSPKGRAPEGMSPRVFSNLKGSSAGEIPQNTHRNKKGVVYISISILESIDNNAPHFQQPY